MALHPQSEFVPPRCRKDQQRNIDPEIRDLEAIADLDVGKRGPADELFGVEVDQLDIKMVQAFRIGKAEIEAHLLMLEGEGRSLQMCEDSDQAFLFRQAVLDDLVADEKRLDSGFRDIGHGGYSKETRRNGTTVPVFLQIRGGGRGIQGKGWKDEGYVRVEE